MHRCAATQRIRDPRVEIGFLCPEKQQGFPATIYDSEYGCTTPPFPFAPAAAPAPPKAFSLDRLRADMRYRKSHKTSDLAANDIKSKSAVAQLDCFWRGSVN